MLVFKIILLQFRMILNISKIKTESLLLFCKDLISSYIDNDSIDYGVDKDIVDEFDEISRQILTEIKKVTFKDEYYLKNRNHYRIKAVLNCYNYLNSEISKMLKQNEAINPSMLYFSLLTLWFKELNKESSSKEYIFFLLYPYTNIYDKLLIKIKNPEFKELNIKMIELAENLIERFDKVKL